MTDSRQAEYSASLTVPFLLAVAAPVAVIVCIEWLRQVWLTFAIYQLGICLVAPALESWRRGLSWREHVALLGLRESGGLRLGAVLGLATVLVTGAFLILTSARFLDAARLEAVVTDWGAAPEHVLPVLVFMAVFNAPAEELFWRGYLPGRVQEVRAPDRPPVLLTIILPALLYASYHVVTIGRLVGFNGAAAAGAIVMVAGILAAGLTWGWLRQRSGSVWPALLSHSGAVIAYLAVHLWLTRGG